MANGHNFVPPHGTRDLLHPEAEIYRELRQKLLSVCRNYGYDPVEPSPFEYAESLQTSLGEVQVTDLLHFVETKTGRVAAFRPDITPQVARVVGTRLRDRQGPWRLCYHGQVLRRRRGRARNHRQTEQVGFECIGVDAPIGDIEVLSIVLNSCAQLGLEDWCLELSPVPYASAFVQRTPLPAQEHLTRLILQKDESGIRDLCREEKILEPLASALQALPGMFGAASEVGSESCLNQARRYCLAPEQVAIVAELERVLETLHRWEVNERIMLDFGELRGQSYYTGLRYSLLAPTLGEPFGSGGRYDNLMKNYGMEQCAAGFAFDLDVLQRLLKIAPSLQGCGRILLIGSDFDAYESFAAELRRSASVGFYVSDDWVNGLEHAKVWDYDALVGHRNGGWRFVATRQSRINDETSLEPSSVEGTMLGAELAEVPVSKVLQLLHDAQLNSDARLHANTQLLRDAERTLD